MAQAPRDNNLVTTLLGTSNADGITPVAIYADPTTHRLLVDVTIASARVVSTTDATSITPTGDTADMNTQVNTQNAGTLTINAPSGTPSDGQRLFLRIKATNAQTFSWASIYRGGTDIPLPTGTSAGGPKTYYFEFIYNSGDVKWDIIRAVNNYV